MIHHCVFLRFKPTITPADKAALWAELVQAALDGLQGLMVFDLERN